MKNLIILLLIIPLFAGSDYTQREQTTKSKVYDYLNNLNYPYLTDDIKARYTDVICRNSIKYRLNAMHLARQIHAESTFKWWAGNKIAFGAMGIRPKYWSHLLYKVDPNLIEYLDTKESHIKYLKRIGYNIEIGSHILRYYLDRNDDDYRLALISYWAGMNSKQYKRAKKKLAYYYDNQYVNKIL